MRLELDQALGEALDRVAPLARVEAQDEDDVSHSAGQPGDLRLERKDGSYMLVERSLSSIHDRDDRLVGTVMVLRDITESRALSSRMTFLAHHDALTGLPNRLQLNERLGQAITHATNHGNGIAVLFLDLDLFKHVNDALGHHTGDELLQQVARRLQRNVGNLGTVYRTGGDEFVVLLPNVVTRDSVLQVADRLLALCGTPYTVASHELHQAFSIGISLFPDDGYDAGTLMMRADAAMYLAKRNGRNASRFYTRELASSVDARIELENSLRRSLRNGDLILHYQPQIDSLSGRIVGVEGLARWQRGDRLVLPGEFLPIAEETRLIVDIDQWAIRAACRQNRIWQQAGLPPIRVSVNIAAANFDTDDLVDTVVEALQDSGLPAEFLELEVTETTLMRDVQRTDRTLRALKSLGVRSAIDDFGTGFSSLSYLGNYGFNVLKIDQTFVRDVGEPNQAAITRAIIGLRRNCNAARSPRASKRPRRRPGWSPTVATSCRATTSACRCRRRSSRACMRAGRPGTSHRPHQPRTRTARDAGPVPPSPRGRRGQLVLLAHDAHRDLQRLLVIQPRIDGRAIRTLEIQASVKFARATGAFGHVLASQFQVHAAQARTRCRMQIERLFDFAADVVEATRLETVAGALGVAVHRDRRPTARDDRPGEPHRATAAASRRCAPPPCDG